MSSKKILNPNLPGGLLSATNAGDEFTGAETLLVQNLNAGIYENIVPTGAVNDSNMVFTLPASPSPASSLEFRINGQVLKAGGTDFTLSGATVTLVTPPATDNIITVTFHVNT